MAMPLHSRSCHWQFGGDVEQQGGLPDLLQFLEAQFPGQFRLQQFSKDLADGCFLASDIPVGYGLGSSAAVCVAVFERYSTERGKVRLLEQGPKAYFAPIEAHFHGTSSGTDPLIIYQRSSIRLSPDGECELIPTPQLPEAWQFFLLDTGRSRETAPIVNYFTHRYDTDSRFRNITDEQWIPATDQAIAALLSKDIQQLLEAFRQISAFQLAELPPMVLPKLHGIWQAGLNSGHYLLKICGAGGGGYCLGLTADWEKTKQMLADWPLELVQLHG